MTFTSQLRKSALISGLFISSAIAATPAFADGSVQGYPSRWRLQDYQDGAITLFYTGSPCPSGELILSSSASAESRARLWSVLLTAIGTNKQVGLYYDSGCFITNFYMNEN